MPPPAKEGKGVSGECQLKFERSDLCRPKHCSLSRLHATIVHCRPLSFLFYSPTAPIANAPPISSMILLGQGSRSASGEEAIGRGMAAGEEKSWSIVAIGDERWNEPYRKRTRIWKYGELTIFLRVEVVFEDE